MDEAGRTRLVRLVSAGDRDALQCLILHYHGALQAFVAGRLDGKLRARVDVDDVLQEAYVAAFKDAETGRFENPAAFYGWLEIVVERRLQNVIRAAKQQKRDVRREVGQADGRNTRTLDLLQQVPAAGSTPSRQMAMDEAAGAVLTSLARLSEDQRRAIRMRFIEGREVREIADLLGKTEAAVHMLFHRGLAALRERMGSITQYLTRL